MRILVTGSREWVNKRQLVGVLSSFAPANKLTFVCGYDPVNQTPSGADQLTYEYVIWHRYYKQIIDIETYPADWGRKCDEKCYHPTKFRPTEIDGQTVLVPYCPVAGHLRNQQMVDSGEFDLCIGFLVVGAKNRGTLDCLRRARKAGIKCVRYYDG